MSTTTKKNGHLSLLISCLMFVLTAFPFGTAIAGASSNNTLPAHTLYQAYKVIEAQFPGAKNLQARPYISSSISGVVGTVLNASTVVEFEYGETKREVVMLPDGQHLLIGTIVKPKTGRDQQPQSSPIKTKASQPVAAYQAKKITPTSISKSNNPMDKYRLTNSSFDAIYDQPALSPDEFIQTMENHDAIITGNGPNHVFIFTDPNCPNCRKEYLSAQQHLDQFTFHWIPVYAVTPQPGPQQVAISQDSADTNKKNLHQIMLNPKNINLVKIETSDEIANRLREHQLLFYNLKDKRTPVTIYRNADGIPTGINGTSDTLLGIIYEDMASTKRVHKL